VLLADGTVLLAHDGLEANYGLSRPFWQSTWADLAGRRYLGRYTILRSQDLLRLLADHPDVHVIPDPKYSRPQIFRAQVRQAAAMGRLDLRTGSCRTSRTRPSWTSCGATTRCRTTCWPCTTRRRRTGTTTGRRSTSCGATAPPR
jgi:hypothetical protein